MSAHLIPANAGAFAELQNLSTRSALADITVPRDDQDIKDYIAFLTHPNLPYSGFGIRRDIAAINASAAWHITPDAAQGHVIVWEQNNVIVFHLVRGDQECEDVLSQLFGFAPDEMPPHTLIDSHFSRGIPFEDAHSAFFTEISRVLGEKKTIWTLDGPDINFRRGVRDPQHKATMESIRTALDDAGKEARLPARQQALEAFPAFDLTDTETTRRIDAGEPLTEHFRNVHGVMPATLKALRAHYAGDRFPPRAFAGVYGPDVPAAPIAMRSFKGLLGFAHKNDIPFRFFAPLANRFSTGICSTFMTYMAHVLDEVPEGRAAEIFEKNGGHRLMIRNAEAVRDRKQQQRETYQRAHRLIDAIPDLRVKPVRAAAYRFRKMGLRLVSSADELFQLDEKGWRIRHLERDGITPGAVGQNITFYVTCDMDDLGSGYFIECDAEGRPLSAFCQKFSKLFIPPIEGYETWEAALHDLMDDLDAQTEVKCEIAKISQMPACVAWSRRYRGVVDGIAAAERRDDRLRPHLCFGYESEAEFRADVPAQPDTLDC